MPTPTPPPASSSAASPSPGPHEGQSAPNEQPASRMGWGSLLARVTIASLALETVSGLAITLAPFSPWMQWNVLLHTILGAATLLPIAWYSLRHLIEYRRCPASHITVLGWVALAGLACVAGSGIVITLQALLGSRTDPIWRQTHLYATYASLAGLLPHLIAAIIRQRGVHADAAAGESTAAPTPATAATTKATPTASARPCMATAGVALAVGVAVCIGLGSAYSGTRYNNRFPVDYNFLYGTNRPFAPSLARTDSGGAFDSRSLAGSRSCGTAGCHEQILSEWMPSAHRYAAMDSVFLGIQDVMAKQNGPESTRYCGGCHDPISLFSGTKNIFVENLTGLQGYQEGVSCLACHAIRETDIKGNANYVVTQPHEYLWQWSTNGVAKAARDFLIRSYPNEHNRLAKRAFKKPEYCAACHKQFIDAEVNRVGWVQLQNQYDNWAASHWNKKGDAKKTVECRECHMPLVASHDPSSGDSLDYNRTPGDRKHRSHRFIAANTIMPVALKDKLDGWKTQLDLTETWLRGELPVPEIADKWANGPIVKVAVSAPETVATGENIPLRVVMASNKVGHDFPTGPLDIIQSWLEVSLTNPKGDVVWTSGKRDNKNFLQKGTFLFKAEPVDQHGNLIDRHNLWEMVGVRFRRALFPGYSDTVNFSIPCSGALDTTSATTSSQATNAPAQSAAKDSGSMEIPTPSIPAPAIAGEYRIDVSLQYRKVDQFLLNFLFGETNKLTSPVTRIAGTSIKVNVLPAASKPQASAATPSLPTEREAALARIARP